MSERRYSEEQVAEIFRRATETATTDRRALTTANGMTLPELQEIGRQAGIAPELVSRAAQALDSGGTVRRRSFLGLPIGVGRTVELGRKLTDEEWERLVADLRETFDAKGVVTRDGTLRQWSNGNLHAMLEPGESGHRLRMRTYNGNARRRMAIGLLFLFLAAIIAVGGPPSSAGQSLGTLILGPVGVGLFALGALQLPGWARRRLAQMEGIGARLLSAPHTTPDDPRVQP